MGCPPKFGQIRGARPNRELAALPGPVLALGSGDRYPTLRAPIRGVIGLASFAGFVVVGEVLWHLAF